MTTGIVIMNKHPQQTFEKFCKKHNFKFYGNHSAAKDEADNIYFLLSNHHNVCGRRFDKLIIFGDDIFDIFSHLSPQSISDFGKQDSVLILSERFII